ncbi:hypothetical protein RKD35_000344 [Streptomyces albogriseolus]
MLHLGGTTLPGGLVVTMDAEQGADLLDVIRPYRALPVHHDDYGVFRSPPLRLPRRGRPARARRPDPVLPPGRTGDGRRGHPPLSRAQVRPPDGRRTRVPAVPAGPDEVAGPVAVAG